MSSIKIKIKSLFGKLLFTYECEDNTITKTVNEAVKSCADLRCADLRCADLRSADLSSADLSFADLSFANLRSADLSFADLSSANLRSADLSFADLRSADLRCADLRSADLSFANLRSADLRDIRNDLWDILIRAPKEIAGLKTAITEGKINGSVYKGACACLVGTIANLRNCEYNKIDLITPKSSRPIERFFLGIKPGDTPGNSQVSAMVNTWLDEFISITSQ
jgi:hypothetical protein